MKLRTLFTTALLCATAAVVAPAQITFEGKDGPGKGKKVVLLAGDEEYRSEEVMPMLAKILSERHGFTCTVVWSLDPATGEIDPKNSSNLPGMEALDQADLCIMLWRFRAPKDELMKHFVDYFHAGKPIIALRTSTHAFNYPKDSKSPYAKYGWTSGEWKGGFGKNVLGETWVTHWGKHKSEATKGIIEEAAKNDPILNGVTNLFGDSDVYEAYPPADAKILVRGQVLAGMTPDSKPAAYTKKRATDKAEQDVNSPMMPVIWTREYKNEAGKTNKILTSTLGAATDLKNEDLRRVVVNAAYAFTGLEVPEKANVELVGDYAATMYGFGTNVKGKKPADFAK